MSDADWERLVMPMVIKTEDSECWFWAGYTNQNGHGFINQHETQTTDYVHRISLERKLGREIKRGMWVLHSCFRNPNCVNPDHLREGTNSENQIDSVKEGTSMAKLTEAEVIAIRSDTRNQKEIAEAYGVNQRTISCIKLRQTWKYIP
jgi:hypothetical protein